MSNWNSLGREIARGLCDFERRQGMSANEVYEEQERKRRKKEREEREAYKRMFGVYPEQTWRW